MLFLLVFLFQEENLTEFHAIQHESESQPEQKLKQILETLIENCSNYLSIAKSANAKATCANHTRTKLDKERMRLCIREIVSDMYF